MDHFLQRVLYICVAPTTQHVRLSHFGMTLTIAPDPSAPAGFAPELDALSVHTAQTCFIRHDDPMLCSGGILAHDKLSTPTAHTHTRARARHRVRLRSRARAHDAVTRAACEPAAPQSSPTTLATLATPTPASLFFFDQTLVLFAMLVFSMPSAFLGRSCSSSCSTLVPARRSFFFGTEVLRSFPRAPRSCPRRC